MATYYVITYASGGRDEAGRDGLSVPTAWATPSYAAGRVASGNHIIYVESGDYTDNNRVNLALLVYLLGNSSSYPNITTSYAASGDDGYIRMYSSSNVDGSQRIAYLNVNGNSLTSGRAIYTENRNNVDIDHCNIDDFLVGGIYFESEDAWDEEPSNYITDCSVSYCNITNCSNRAYTHEGLIRAAACHNLLVYNNVFTNNQRDPGDNGNILTLTFQRGSKFHDNTYYRLDDEGGEWAFYCELFHPRGGMEVYNETFIGGGTFDMGASPMAPGTGCYITPGYGYTYALSIHDNSFDTSTGNQLTTRNGGDGGKHHIAIDIEGQLEDVLIYNNHIKNYTQCISMVTGDRDPIYAQERVYIYNNLIENVGYTAYTYTYGIFINDEDNSSSLNTKDNIHIWNNTITGGAGLNYYGIICNMRGTITNCSIKNNIIYDFDQEAVHISKQTDGGDQILYLTDFDVTYNNFYSCGGTITRTNITSETSCDFSTGNQGTSTNPGLNADWTITSPSSAVYHAGTDVGLDTDILGNAWYPATPSMGCYEYGSTPPEEESSALAPTLLEDLRAWWECDEASGTVYDSTANNYDGSVSNPPTYHAAGPGGNFTYALEFDGSNDVVDFGATVGDVGTNDFTIVGWVYLVSSVNTYNGICGNWGSEPYFYLNFNESDYFRVRFSPSAGVFVNVLSNNAVSTGTWYHFAVLFDRSGNITVYLNNTLQTQTGDISSYSATNIANSNSFNIGNIGSALSGYFGNIRVCGFGIYTRLLTTTEIGQLYGGLNYPFGSEFVPDTNDFSLLDVCNVVIPTTNDLIDNFSDAIASYFDPVYEGDHDRLSNFRNYGGTPITPVYYTITASAGTGGSIEPDGEVEVAEDTDRTFYIYADSGYEINRVEVDSVSQGDIDIYTFLGVAADHTIEAFFDALIDTLVAGTIGSASTICYNTADGTLSFSVAPSGGVAPYVYQWQSSPNNSTWSVIGGATTTTYAVPTLTSTTYYRCRVTDNASTIAYTNSVQITVRAALTAGTVCCNQTITTGETPTALYQTVEPTGGAGGYTYQWYSSLNGSSWSIIAGATSSGYAPGTLTANMWYKRVTTDSVCGTADSNSVAITVSAAFADWSFPNIAQLIRMRNELHLYSLGGFSESNLYWSSDQYGSSAAYAFNFANGLYADFTKASTFYVRAIRNFTTIGDLYDLRDTGPAGGLICYKQNLFGSTWVYEEVAPSDQSSNATWATAVSLCEDLII